MKRPDKLKSIESRAQSGSGRTFHKFCGLLRRKECWSLSWRGRLAVVVVALVTGLVVLFTIHPFLAATKRVDSRDLVVEGWVHEYAVQAAVREFTIGSYTHVFVTGGPVEGNGGYVNDFQTSASVGAKLLKKDGIPDVSLQMVPSRVMDRDRTYSSAVALRDWFREHDMSVRSINVLTEGAHARRTWFLFQEAFGKDVKVGIISVPSPDFDAKHWWRSSEGVREIIDETFAYLYAKFVFRPSSQQEERIMKSAKAIRISKDD
jgi:hypothetical protein